MSVILIVIGALLFIIASPQLVSALLNANTGAGANMSELHTLAALGTSMIAMSKYGKTVDNSTSSNSNTDNSNSDSSGACADTNMDNSSSNLESASNSASSNEDNNSNSNLNNESPDNSSSDISIPNTIQKEDIVEIYNQMLESNNDCKIMIQPFIPEINNGEYSCIFIGGELTHTMLRFPNIFHEKRRSYLVNDVPDNIIELAKTVEKIKEFNGYLYMRVDMVLIGGKAKIMEVELADPDFLTKYIDDSNVKSDVIKTFAKKIERRVRQNGNL